MRTRRISLVLVALLAPLCAAQTPQPEQERVRRLETQVEQLQQQLDVVLEELAQPGRSSDASTGGGNESESRFSFGGYGESHANFVQGSENDYLDIHRFVFYLGYEFDDWIQLHSETEIEHAFVSSGDGELSVEQLHFDFSMNPGFNVRAGRYLVPVGITNKTHEPTTFYSVERPSVEKTLIPSTWFQDGVGIYGRLANNLEYEIYLGSGLDGSEFTAMGGIRSGRMKERPGIHEPGLTGRLDYYPMANDPDHDLRIGASFFTSGLDNANKGTSGAPGRLMLLSGDAQYRYGDFEARGVYVHEKVEDAEELNAFASNDVGELMSGYYVEAAYHVMPESWKTGKLDNADAVVFARFEDYDTQDKVPTGAVRDPDAAREEVTTGLACFLTQQLVIKADYTWRDDRPDLWNLGMGFTF